MIDDIDEKLKYHIVCLVRWFNENNIGIITRKKVNKYIIYINNELNYIDLNSKDDSGDCDSYSDSDSDSYSDSESDSESDISYSKIIFLSIIYIIIIMYKDHIKEYMSYL